MQRPAVESGMFCPTSCDWQLHSSAGRSCKLVDSRNCELRGLAEVSIYLRCGTKKHVDEQ